MVTTHQATIEALGGYRQVAADLGCTPIRVWHWHRRGRIPAEHWQAVATLAKRRRVPGVTITTLARTLQPGRS